MKLLNLLTFFFFFFFLFIFSKNHALICRDLALMLMELSKEFNIDRFLSMLLEALVDCRWKVDHHFM